jgi:hypothetical protein
MKEEETKLIDREQLIEICSLANLTELETMIVCYKYNNVCFDTILSSLKISTEEYFRIIEECRRKLINHIIHISPN